jgi:hypothetical protein
MVDKGGEEAIVSIKRTWRESMSTSAGCERQRGSMSGSAEGEAEVICVDTRQSGCASMAKIVM